MSNQSSLGLGGRPTPRSACLPLHPLRDVTTAQVPKSGRCAFSPSRPSIAASARSERDRFLFLATPNHRQSSLQCCAHLAYLGTCIHHLSSVSIFEIPIIFTGTRHPLRSCPMLLVLLSLELGKIDMMEPWLCMCPRKWAENVSTYTVRPYFVQGWAPESSFQGFSPTPRDPTPSRI